MTLALLVVAMLSSRGPQENGPQDIREPNPLAQSDPQTAALPDAPPPDGETTDPAQPDQPAPPSKDSSPDGSTPSATVDSNPAAGASTVPGHDLAADNPQETGSADSPAVADTGSPPDLVPHKEPGETATDVVTTRSGDTRDSLR